MRDSREHASAEAKTRRSDLHLAWLALYSNSPRVPEMRLGVLISILGVVICANAPGAVTLPMRTVFKGQGRFEQLIVRAKAENWKTLPIGERTAVVGQAMVGTA